jgi:S-adenosyl-L-methionine hydrolase (adenosine-forming)
VSTLLTLTTDFGTQDAYVATMKGVIASVSREIRTIDITHSVGVQDVMAAAWLLLQAIPFFPPSSVHLVVVDPGVGTKRRAVACRIAGHTFVGPDNGMFSLLLGDDGLGPAAPEEVVVLDRPEWWRTPRPSHTFHGRDIFAPIAAHLACGHTLLEVGTPAPPASLVRMQWVRPRADEQGIQGWVVHIDRFGNAITNIPGALVEAYRAGRSIRCYAGATVLSGLSQTYADVETGEPLVLVGSSGNVEVSVNGGDASTLLSIRKGSAVQVVFVEPR